MSARTAILKLKLMERIRALEAENRELLQKVQALEEKAQKAEDLWGDCQFMRTLELREIAELKGKLKVKTELEKKRKNMVNMIPERIVRWWNKLLFNLSIPTVTGEEKVLACTFCRGEPMLMQVDCGPDGMKRAIRCCTCGMVGPLTTSPAAAIKAWNCLHDTSAKEFRK